MIYTVQYHEAVIEDDIPKLSTTAKQRVRQAIERKLMSAPEQFGKPLRRSLKGYRKLRVGDYRVVFRLEGRIIRVLAIQHRSVIYKQFDRD